MTAHKHAAMIKAKADNVGLVQFIKLVNDWEVVNSHGEEVVIFNDHFQYFLCLQQHKDACLHWLNCGDVQYRHGTSQDWDDYGPIKVWSAGCIFMQEHVEIRIKPRKEKRWMGFNNRTNITTSTLYKSLDAVKNATVRHEKWQFIEIEVEV
ncbi:hypothetical protein [Vibrio phage vB_VaS_L1]|nr:hypothetical protein [Vibrio phage vB_VaS_L1]